MSWASAVLPHFNCDKIAFYKTHKTGSTTLGGVMFRVAAHANMTIYSATNHYISVDHRAVQELQMGATDMFLKHLYYHDSRTWHLRSRAFYSKVLGTSQYAFLTILRHPVDRYMSDFFYYTGPTLKAKGTPISLADFAKEQRETNQMAGAFSIKRATDAYAHAAGEEMVSGLYLPVELLDYGLGLMSARCGWAASQLLYLPVNANVAGIRRFGNVTLESRPSLAQLQRRDPDLVDLMDRINYLDGALYAAAVAALMRHLDTAPPAAFAAAVRILDARLRLGAACRPLRRAGLCAGPRQQVPLQAAEAAMNETAFDELCSLCVWFSLSDVQYEYIPTIDRGTLLKDTSFPTKMAARRWPLGPVLQLVSERFRELETTPYWHTVLGVIVPEGAAAHARAAAWAVHHAHEGVHLLALYAFDAVEVPTLEHTVRDALAACGPGCAFSELRVQGGPPQDTFWRLRQRARWSAFLAHPLEFMYGARGPLRAALLAMEARATGTPTSLCAPLVKWAAAAPPPLPAGSAGAAGVCAPKPCWSMSPPAASSTAGESRCVQVMSLPALSGMTDDVAVRALPLLGHGSRPVHQLPLAERPLQRLQVVQLQVLDSETQAQAGAGSTQAGGPGPCAVAPRPRLNLPWCGA